MARPAIVWRNPRFAQPRRMWIPAASDPKHSVYLIVESASAAGNEWNGLPNLEVIPGKPKAAAAAACRGLQSSGA
jgi:hypothetical protein